MTHFAWLQTRTQTLATAAAVLVLAGIAAITGVQLSHLFHADVAHCTGDCGFAIDRFLSHDTFLDNTFDILARVVPALIGIFWGAPLFARELETGTYRLAWTQSVPRSRWVATKLAVGALVTVLLAGALTVTITWWYTSRDQVGGSTPFQVFDRRDVVPVAYALFAFLAGALLGALIRRTLPAMAAALAVFIAARVVIGTWVRPHLMSPLHSVLTLFGAGPGSNVQLGIGSANGGPLQIFVKGEGPLKSWTLSNHLVTSSGHRVTSSQMTAFIHQHCPNVALPAGGGPGKLIAPGPTPGRDCLDQVAHTFKLVVTYQPNSRYWTFQWFEAGIFVVLALACAAACYWWLTRRGA